MGIANCGNEVPETAVPETVSSSIGKETPCPASVYAIHE